MSFNKLLFKLITYVPFIILIFIIIKLFTLNPNSSWQTIFNHFSVPANFYPGGDSRNIQLAAYCKSKFELVDFSACYEEAYPTKDLYPSITIPAYNYPEIWKSIYILFNNYSENFFIIFWSINAIALILTLFFLAIKTNLSFFIVALFSPVTLLAIERGNIDALTFFILFFPIFFNLKIANFNSFFVMLAASLKIFPIFVSIIYFLDVFKKNNKLNIIGLIIGLPLFFWSLSSIIVIDQNSLINIKIISDTVYGFKVAYGFFSLLNAPYFKDNHEIAIVVLILFLLIVMLFFYSSKKKNSYKGLFQEISNLSLRDSFLFFSSILIFGITFIIFVNWSYRLIFLFPAMFVLSRFKTYSSRKILFLIILLFWSPILGWNLQNLISYILFLFLVPVYVEFFNFKKLIKFFSR